MHPLCGPPSLSGLVGACRFYVEATPVWNRPRRSFDLRGTLTSFYLKAITPISVNPGYKPYLFVANVESEPYATKSDIVAFIHRTPLALDASGTADWRHHQIRMAADPEEWLCYNAGKPNRRADQPTGGGAADASLVNAFRPIGAVLARCGFVGVMFCRVLAEAAPLVDIEFPPNVGARGILGIDELRYNRI